jgi:hypothetical protein
MRNFVLTPTLARQVANPRSSVAELPRVFSENHDFCDSRGTPGGLNCRNNQATVFFWAFLAVKPWLAIALLGLLAVPALAGVGDPQLKTDHPWYPGELAMSTFDRLFAAQAELYERVTGERPVTDEQKALAAWLWRNTHYAHGEEGKEDLFGGGFEGPNNWTREYWTGLYSHGFALCGTTHAQWCAEMEALLGHGRARAVGTAGHNSFEVFLKGGAYGDGKWVLLDHDISTIIFSDDGARLLSIPEIKEQLQKYTDQNYKRQRQHGWLVSGLHPDDAKGVYGEFNTAEYFSGYSGPPPMVHLRRGEKLRRYFMPGLEDGKTFVFWGHNYNTAGIPGPERSRTWVNQPEKMYNAENGTPHRDGQVRYANAVFTYEPNFADGSYKEGVIEETKDALTFEFQSPYVIAATPWNQEPWGIYSKGCKNGLVIEGRGVKTSVSVDRGATWSESAKLEGQFDLTDRVKGQRQYWLRLHFDEEQKLADAGLRWTTVCQCNVAVLPRLKDQGTEITYAASNQALVSAGPTVAQAKPHVVDGDFGQNKIALKLKTPRDEPVSQIFAATHVASSNPPDGKVKYQIEYSLDEGKSWQALVRDWTIPRRGEEPADFWSQSLCWGSKELKGEKSSQVRVRFRNDGGKQNLRSEMHLAYRVQSQDAMRVTYAWSDAVADDQSASNVFAPSDKPQTWRIPTAKGVVTRWVEMEPVEKE